MKYLNDLEYYCGVDWGFAKGHENVITVMGDVPILIPLI